MDEFLRKRLEELKRIDEFLERLAVKYQMFGSFTRDIGAFRQLELSVMIQRAEESHRKF